MYYTINNSDEVILTLNREDLHALSFLLCSGICNIHDCTDYSDRLSYYRALRDIVYDAADELDVYYNPDFMEGDKL